MWRFMHVHINRSDIHKKWLNFLEMRLSKIDQAPAIGQIEAC